MDHYIDTTMVDNSNNNQSFENISEIHQAISKHVIRMTNSSSQDEIIKQLMSCNNWQNQKQENDYFESVKNVRAFNQLIWATDLLFLMVILSY